MAGFDDNGPQLYQIDPSGSYFAWKASAIGKNMTNAKTFLEKRCARPCAAAAAAELLPQAAAAACMSNLGAMQPWRSRGTT
jgi:20S proteasome alpha/beta subunit